MHTLIDFLNHGILPFTGRAHETEAVLAFWSGTSGAQELRAALLLGEAGIGKSRLLAETLPRIVRAGGAVVHARLYPESTLSIIPLIANALWTSDAGRRLLREEPAATLPSVTGALRRLARLRPTLIVIEDIHLLRGDALREFTALLNAIADETISLLCVARPVELEVRPVLERCLTGEIRLEGLRPAELRRLLDDLFESAPGEEMLGPLLERTLGNPLALRSALRGVVNSGALRGEHDGWRMTVTPKRFGEMLGRSVDLLSEGLTAELGPEERRGAEQLAALGEVFSREAAHAMLADADQMIELLTFKGIIVPSSLVPQPLPGSDSNSPLFAFTHTLVHRFCVEHATIDAGRLIRTIALGLPLYSILPFELLAAGDIGDATAAEAEGAIRRALHIAQTLDYTAGWETSPKFWRMAVRLADAFRGERTADRQHLIELTLLHTQMSLNRRQSGGREFNEALTAILAMTNNPSTEEVARYRLASLCRLRGITSRYDQERSWEIWREAEEMVEKFPSLRTTLPYLFFLQDTANAAAAVADLPMLRRVEENLESILATGDVGEEYRRFARGRIFPFLLLVFDTPAGLAHRMRMLADAEGAAAENDLTLLTLKTGFLARIGHINEMLRLSERSLPLFIERGTLRNFYTGKVHQLCGRGALGERLEELEREARALASEAPAENVPAFTQFIGEGFIDLGLLRDDPAWARSMAEEFLPEGAPLKWAQQALLTLDADPGLLRTLSVGKEEPGITALLGLATGEPGADREAARLEAERILSLPTLRVGEIITARGVIDLVEYMARSAGEEGLAASLRAEIAERIGEMLGWLAGRELPLYMGPLIKRYRHYLSGEEAAGWERRRAELEARRRVATQPPPPDRWIVVSMLGAITIRRPGSEPERLRGGRLSALLGLLVADRMLEVPLAHREFCAIATGNEEEPERARKSLNKAVQRLREAIGHEAILTDGETPRLNPVLVGVDLLDAHRLIGEAIAATRSRPLMHAIPPLRRALELTRGEVPFPSLYEDFFEAAREDFELRLRAAVVDAARALLREGDPGGAEELLGATVRLMPGDDELAEMLRGALVALGRNTDAERIRMHSSAH